jgi:hypothetical protein
MCSCPRCSRGCRTGGEGGGSCNARCCPTTCQFGYLRRGKQSPFWLPIHCFGESNHGVLPENHGVVPGNVHYGPQLAGICNYHAPKSRVAAELQQMKNKNTGWRPTGPRWRSGKIPIFRDPESGRICRADPRDLAILPRDCGRAHRDRPGRERLSGAGGAGQRAGCGMKKVYRKKSTVNSVLLKNFTSVPRSPSSNRTRASRDPC